MGGPGAMMLPPPTPFSGTSGMGVGTGNGYLDPSALSTSALPLNSGELILWLDYLHETRLNTLN